MDHLLVQKYGGASLATPEKIRAVAQRIADERARGKKILVAVSAMANSTDELIRLAHQISKRPPPRELDMLVSTGERVSMSLMSMALQELAVPAISFTGSQAGIITNDAHVNAKIIDVRAFRVREALEQNKVVVLAGFQGVSEQGKEVTTLGRGGTDTTAIAMASYLGAERVEILKEVPGVMTADPRRIGTAKLISQISLGALSEMTFWGAKVLHYRSVELAWQKNLEIFIGPADSEKKTGTAILRMGEEMLEQPRVLAVNSHSRVLCLEVRGTGLVGIEKIRHGLRESNIAIPQFLQADQNVSMSRFFITAPNETLDDLIELKPSHGKNGFELSDDRLCVATVTCIGSFGEELLGSLLSTLDKNQIYPEKISVSAMSLHFFMKDESLGSRTGTPARG